MTLILKNHSTRPVHFNTQLLIVLLVFAITAILTQPTSSAYCDKLSDEERALDVFISCDAQFVLGEVIRYATILIALHILAYVVTLRLFKNYAWKQNQYFASRVYHIDLNVHARCEICGSNHKELTSVPISRAAYYIQLCVCLASNFKKWILTFLLDGCNGLYILMNQDLMTNSINPTPDVATMHYSSLTLNYIMLATLPIGGIDFYQLRDKRDSKYEQVYNQINRFASNIIALGVMLKVAPNAAAYFFNLEIPETSYMRVYAPIPGVDILLTNFMGYMVYELAVIMFTEKPKLDMITHHLLAIVLASYGLHPFNQYFALYMMGVLELSTIFLCIGNLLRLYKKCGQGLPLFAKLFNKYKVISPGVAIVTQRSNIEDAVNITFGFLFFIVRVIGLFPLLVVSLYDMHSIYNSPMCVHDDYAYIVTVAGSLSLYVLQLRWMKLIIKKIMCSTIKTIDDHQIVFLNPRQTSGTTTRQTTTTTTQPPAQVQETETELTRSFHVNNMGEQNQQLYQPITPTPTLTLTPSEQHLLRMREPPHEPPPPENENYQQQHQQQQQQQAILNGNHFAEPVARKRH